MPQFIRTPEQIFREEGKDIFVIRFKKTESDDLFTPSHETNPARKEILLWLKEYTPNALVEFLAPSESSGFICGYFGDLRVDFSDTDLAVYCARWEKEDGESIDPRFQCDLWRYKPWLEITTRYTPTIARPYAPGLSQWWDTPMGIVYHQISTENGSQRDVATHPGNELDIWFNAVRLWPELASLNPYEVTRGYTIKHKGDPWTLVYIPGGPVSNPLKFPLKRQRELVKWLMLPNETKIVEDAW